MKETIINYDVINFLTKTLALRFKLNSRNFTHVIGIARGGLVPATIMSHMFDADLLTYNVKSYKGKRQGEFKIIQDIDLDALPENSEILVIDDICDSGKTFTKVKELIGTKFKFVRYAALFTKKGSKSVIDHYGVEVKDDNWLVFPWED